MTRQGRINGKSRQPSTLLVKCKGLTLILHGCGERTAAMFEGYACAEVAAPLEVTDIQEITWVDFDESSLVKKETIFKNDFVLTGDECVSLTQDEKTKEKE